MKILIGNKEFKIPVNSSMHRAIKTILIKAAMWKPYDFSTPYRESGKKYDDEGKSFINHHDLLVKNGYVNRETAHVNQNYHGDNNFETVYDKPLKNGGHRYATIHHYSDGYDSPHNESKHQIRWVDHEERDAGDDMVNSHEPESFTELHKLVKAKDSTARPLKSKKRSQ